MTAARTHWVYIANPAVVARAIEIYNAMAPSNRDTRNRRGLVEQYLARAA